MNPRLFKDWIGVELSEVSPKEKVISGLGGLISILLTVFTCMRLLPGDAAVCVIASMGASAVLLFAVPHGQLSQPWPVVAGHTVSALLGVLCAKIVRPTELSAACAVALSIVAMHQLKCIHPPGGATALTAVLGNTEIHGRGFDFVLFPVLTNSLMMVSIAVLFNACFAWRRYPAFFRARGPRTVTVSASPSHDDVIKALREFDSFVDISEEDLLRLVKILAPLSKKAGSGPSCDQFT